jgi:phosphate starvation-inducible protein PhoH
MKITGNKYFTKGKRTQQAVRAIARSGEKAVKLIGRGNNALSRIESRILQAAKTATHNPRVKISRAVRQTANALLNDPRLKI